MYRAPKLTWHLSPELVRAEAALYEHVWIASGDQLRAWKKRLVESNYVQCVSVEPMVRSVNIYDPNLLPSGVDWNTGESHETIIAVIMELPRLQSYTHAPAPRAST
jgi:hypothetical protein